jgi:hypothetical protein
LNSIAYESYDLVVKLADIVISNEFKFYGLLSAGYWAVIEQQDDG